MNSPTIITFVGYKKPNFTEKVRKYTAQLNPESYQDSVEIAYDNQAAPGTSAGPSQFVGIKPRIVKLELLFDSTGVVEKSPTDLAAEIESFKKVVCVYVGSIHSPYFLKIYWGKMQMGAILTSLSFNYTLFKPNGAPLRAKANCTFREYVDASTQAKRDNQQSPDVTHAITVRDGDNLPMLCQRIYGDPEKYLAVADFNQLTSFRTLRPGQELLFPPLVS